MNRITFFLIALFLQLNLRPEGYAQTKPADKNAGKTLRIMSYNIHHANPPSKPDLIDLDAIARVITASKADIVALQEVETGVSRSGGANEAKILAEKTGFQYHFFKAIDYDGGDYGIAILSRYPLKEIRLVPLPQQITAEKRILGYATIKVGKQKIIFANTHLDASRTDENRLVQMQSILKEFEHAALPVILCGDLNSVAGSSVISLLDAQFKRTCTENCPPTSPQINPRRTIDYIATKNVTWPLLEYQVIAETYASDHRPVMAIFNLEK
ncbi:endonuclease/exonuclease/phosphatase family protein [Pedobacter heparinus]|uniref:Endonuclease/exonuclease/phosphatase n=1 Tax=Pedobacter heparinus (strain ATCC 13125 / DSM 2366 / CIP 104194 / JCM 7457 / NBRC 12017 / NCIMB 9290 / NRRL B-14731 / HIM 762-3) TaxID=485917 RepID=C6XUW9_PEDHD|nr:endonuclease/exonuclease/phosphatase family protein [Pedobacter heparinus]ACU05977.1 Endonuclease/exonuclease/phosphatase [Pedobacter heparinus DSM 2366]